MVLDDEVGEGGGEAGLDGEGPGAGGAERGEEAAKAVGRAVLRRAGHRRPRPSPGSIGGRSAGARAGGRLIGRGFLALRCSSVLSPLWVGCRGWPSSCPQSLCFWGVRRPWENRKGRASAEWVLFSFQLFFVLFLFFGLLEKE